MFHIVDFIHSNETEIVPSSWVHDGMSYWCPYKDRLRCDRAVMRQEPPDPSWNCFDVIIKCTKDTYAECKAKMPRALVNESATEYEDDRPAYLKRKGRYYQTITKGQKQILAFIAFLGLAGGMSTKESVWRIMAKVLTNSLAKTINWRGANNKQKMESLIIKKVILSAVRQNSFCSKAVDEEIEKYIKRWLQLAGDRDGGRKKRLEKARPNEM
ncbi:uncharacterized protein LOC134328420 [Trichomycterus rosablanca]|uniref:uncharacterized protein LOC134328420 n=1 Tax=Trichomycterus rosablanca TaxID=2290929 RepID=UPI002F34F4C7